MPTIPVDLMFIRRTSPVEDAADGGAYSREGMQRARGKMAKIGNSGKKILGTIMLALGILVLSGLDKQLEIALLNMTPDWLISLSTSI